MVPPRWWETYVPEISRKLNDHNRKAGKGKDKIYSLLDCNIRKVLFKIYVGSMFVQKVSGYLFLPLSSAYHSHTPRKFELR